METSAISLPASHYRLLEKIVTALVAQYDTQYIICFGCVEESKTTLSCFGKGDEHDAVRYYLLMLTTQTERMEHQVQDYVDSHFPNCRTVMCVHGLNSVTHAVNQGSRFFATACRQGMQLYSKSGLRLSLPYHCINPLTTLNRAETKYHHYYGMALGFWDGADHSYGAENYAICVFMLHQAVEHACKALIRVFTAYRTEMHNLNRLMDFCLLFSNKLSQALPRVTEEDKRLFTLLKEGYSEARYNDRYVIKQSDALVLLSHVRELLEATEELGQQRLTSYRSEAEASASPVSEISKHLHSPISHAS